MDCSRTTGEVIQFIGIVAFMVAKTEQRGSNPQLSGWHSIPALLSQLQS